MRYSCQEIYFWCVKSYASQSKMGWFSLCWFLQQQSLSLPKCDKDLGNFDKLTNFSAATERSSTSYLGFLRLCNFLLFCHKKLHLSVSCSSEYACQFSKDMLVIKQIKIWIFIRSLRPIKTKCFCSKCTSAWCWLS